VFPYSERPGTFAARRTDAVEPATLTQRAAILRNLSQERFLSAIQKQVGSEKFGLSLRSGKWLTRDFWNVELEDQTVPPNQERAIHIDRTEGEVLIGHLLS
jgi:tRNA A37 methylthiotransferase MiaB